MVLVPPKQTKEDCDCQDLRLHLTIDVWQMNRQMTDIIEDLSGKCKNLAEQIVTMETRHAADRLHLGQVLVENRELQQRLQAQALQFAEVRNSEAAALQRTMRQVGMQSSRVRVHQYTCTTQQRTCTRTRLHARKHARTHTHICAASEHPEVSNAVRTC